VLYVLCHVRVGHVRRMRAVAVVPRVYRHHRPLRDVVHLLCNRLPVFLAPQQTVVDYKGGLVRLVVLYLEKD
jgi:hypothetical protein